MVGDIASDMYLRTVVGMGSRSQDELDDWDKKLACINNVLVNFTSIEKF